MYTWSNGKFGQLGSLIKGVYIILKIGVLNSDISVNRSFKAVQIECGKGIIRQGLMRKEKHFSLETLWVRNMKQVVLMIKYINK